MRLRIILISVLSLILVSCSQSIKIDSSSVTSVLITPFQQKQSVEMNELSFTDKKSINAFLDMVNNSRKINGSIDSEPGDYQITFILSNGDKINYNIWLDLTNSVGILINDDNTEEGYNLISKDVERVLAYWNYEKNQALTQK